MKKIKFLLIFILLIIPFQKINASSLNEFMIRKDYDPNIEKTVTLEELGIKIQKILPVDGILYKFKDEHLCKSFLV